MGFMLSSLPQYSRDPEAPVYFYGGWASSFADYPFHATPMRPLDVRIGRARGGGRPILTFPTREHWFAAHKTLSVERFEAILAAGSPQDAKSLGRDKGLTVLRPGWDEGLAFAVMVEGLRHQLVAHTELREVLRATGDRLIAEDSPMDFIWGCRDENGGTTGRNLLGRAWMTVRTEMTA